MDATPQRTEGLDFVDVEAFIDERPVGAFQVRMLALCGLCVVMDGFDVQAIGYVAPALVSEMNVGRAALGPVFGAASLGMLLGALALSVAADKLGRRPVLIASTAFFAVCMLLTTLARNVEDLIVLRFVTGLGLGGIMPNAMALAGEYSPRRMRVTVMMVVSCGFTLGAVLGGLVSVALMSRFGWRSVFYFGGLVPLALAVLMYWSVPESLQFAALRARGLDRARAWLGRIDPGTAIAPGALLVVRERAEAGSPVAELFRGGRASVTVLLWALNFLNLMNLYFLSNWLPTIFDAAGHGQSTAVLAGTVLQVGGTVGTLAMGWVIDRSGFARVLVPVFLVAALSIAAIGQSGMPLGVLFVVVAVAGFCVVGGQPAINALAASYYPTSLRSTGVGWGLGIGRLGSILGPVAAGALIGLQWPNSWIFLAAAVPALVSCLVMTWLALGFRLGTGVRERPAREAMGH